MRVDQDALLQAVDFRVASGAQHAAVSNRQTMSSDQSSSHLNFIHGFDRLVLSVNCSFVLAGSKPTSQVQNGVLIRPDADALNMLPTEEELLTCDCPFCVAYRGRSGSVRGAPTGPPSCAAKAPVTTAVAGAKLAPPLLTAPLKDPFAQGFKATAVIGISCKVCPYIGMLWCSVSCV